MEIREQAVPGQRYCMVCHKPFRAGDDPQGFTCLSCREKRSTECVIFDRDKGVGSIPANLRERYGEVGNTAVVPKRRRRKEPIA
jgi:hypothetical protein